MRDLLNKIIQDKKAIALIGIVFLAILYFDFSVILKAQFAAIKSTGPKIIKLRQDLETLAKDFKKMEDLKKKVAAQGQNAQLKSKRLISQDEIVALLDNISDLAEKNKVVVVQMKHTREASNLKADKSLAAGKTTPILINLELVGDYHAVGKFINDLENGPVLVAVQNIKISSQTKDYLKQKVNLGLRAYVRK